MLCGAAPSAKQAMRPPAGLSTRKSTRIKRLASQDKRRAHDNAKRASTTKAMMDNLAELHVEGEEEQDASAFHCTGELLSYLKCYVPSLKVLTCTLPILASSS